MISKKMDSSIAIITDKSGNITGYSNAKNEVVSNIKIGMNIYDDAFKNMKFYVFETQKNFIYLVRDEKKENFYKKIVENSHDEIFVTDGDGVAVYCNKKFEQNYGIKREKIIGKDCSFIVDDNYVDVLYLDKVIKDKKSITYKQKTKVGRTILNTSVPIFDDDGDVLYVIENCRDITENEILYNVLNHTKSELKRKEKIEELSDGIKENFARFESDSMKNLYNKVTKFVDMDVNLLITGASGTGKSSIAKHIHNLGKRKDNNFVSVNCATIPASLIESELFGYKSGSFTGASNTGKKGLVETADKGTLFLDEIGEVPLNLQSKLLELVQEKTYLPIGDTKKRYADIRIIVATNRDLKEMVKRGEFREDLYYRLNVVQIDMPTLKERKEDISFLIKHFLSFFNTKYKMNVDMEEEVIKCLEEYTWPGNIRECEYLIEYLVLNSQKGYISLESLPKNIISSSTLKSDEDIIVGDYKAHMESLEKKFIISSYKEYNSSYKLAEALNISQSKANRLINKYCK